MLKIKSSPNISKSCKKVAIAVFTLKQCFHLARKVTIHLGFFLRAFDTKKFQKSPNLVTLPLKSFPMTFWTSVTRSGELLHFGQLFCGNNYFAQILRNFCNGVKIFNFSSDIIFGQIYRHLATFYWSHCSGLLCQLHFELLLKNCNMTDTD